MFQFQAADPAENVVWWLMLLLVACGRPGCFETLWHLFKRVPRRPSSLLSTRVYLRVVPADYKSCRGHIKMPCVKTFLLDENSLLGDSRGKKKI